jgi:hypothetical protein
MVSWGSHSSAAPRSACRRTSWRDTRAVGRRRGTTWPRRAWCQHLAAGAEPHVDVQLSPPTTPPGGWTTITWQDARPFRVQRLLHAQRAAWRALNSRVVPAS